MTTLHSQQKFICVVIFCVSEKLSPPLFLEFSFPSLKLLKILLVTSVFLDIPKEISNKEILDDCLPFAKVVIYETCTLVAATRARFNQILIPTFRSYVFFKQCGDIAELKITFPTGVTRDIISLKVQVMFPCDALRLP